MIGVSEKAEEALEALWVFEKKEQPTCRPIEEPTLNELEARGFIKRTPSGVKLTIKGESEARSCVRRHRLAERLLTDILATTGNLVHKTGCTMEHLLYKGLEENICTLLGHPKFCPHGGPIPKGECCRKAKKVAEKSVLPLSELEPQSKVKIAYIHTQNHQILKRIMAMAILPGQEILLLQRFPSYVFQIGKSQFAIDQELAEHIYVRRL